MADWKPTIAIIGAGAVGSYYGGRLAQHGHEVHFLLRSDYEAAVRHGLTVRSCHGDFALPPGTFRGYNDPHRMPRVDLVIIALKATANDQYEALIRPLVKDNTLILTLQNGLGNEDRLAELFGAERILGGLAFVCVNRMGPGVIHHLDYGLIRVGEFVEGNTANAERVVSLFTRSNIQSNVLQSLRYGRWEKLVWNIPFNGLGAVLDLATDQLLGHASGEALVRRIMEEVVAAAAGLGIHLPADTVEQRINLTRSMGSYCSSMQIDRAMGRPMEVEAILGEPVRVAERAGIKVPHISALYHLASIVNTGKSKIGK